MAPPRKEQRQLWVLTSLNPSVDSCTPSRVQALVSEHLKQPGNLSGEAVLGAKTSGLPGTVSKPKRGKPGQEDSATWKSGGELRQSSL